MLKKLAKDMKITVISLAQLNREAAKSGKPMVSDLRDSGKHRTRCGRYFSFK